MYKLPRESLFRFASEDYPFEKFLAWYGRNNLKAPAAEAEKRALTKLLTGSRDDLVSEAGPLTSNLRTNQVSAALTQARNENLFLLLSCLAERGLPSFTVYGEGHLAMLHRALSEIGKAVPLAEVEGEEGKGESGHR